MKKHRKRPQAQKNSRYQTNTDKSHVRVGAVQKSPRYNRSKDGAW